MISDRKRFLLETIIKEYLKTALPVSSGVLVEKYKLDISPATVRNEMMELEDDGFIYQPHTSAGRVPTEAAYELLIDNFNRNKTEHLLKEAENKLLDKVFNHSESGYKQTAKAISEMAGAAVFWAFHKNDLYYTGLTNLFSQPEFKQVNTICDISGVIDRLEDIIDDVFEKIEEGEQVLIGSKNPFGNFLSVVLIKYKYNNQSSIFGVIGPMRMDYHHNLALLDFIKNKFR